MVLESLGAPEGKGWSEPEGKKLPPALDQHILAQTKSRDGGLGPFFLQRCFVFFSPDVNSGGFTLPPPVYGSGKQAFGSVAMFAKGLEEVTPLKDGIFWYPCRISGV